VADSGEGRPRLWIVADPGHPTAGADDHVSAATFIEAIRQVALYASVELCGFPTGYGMLTRWQAKLSGFAEPDLPLRVAIAGEPEITRSGGRPVVAVPLTFTQGARRVATATAWVVQDC
jgi:hypothetical protein